jgi:hypothetical protein
VVLAGNLKALSNIVIQAETIEQATTFAKSCPTLLHGGTVEIREIPKPIHLELKKNKLKNLSNPINLIVIPV